MGDALHGSSRPVRPCPFDLITSNYFAHIFHFFLAIISNFGFEFVLTISWLNAPSMVISIVRRHPALLLGKQRFERVDT